MSPHYTLDRPIAPRRHSREVCAPIGMAGAGLSNDDNYFANRHQGIPENGYMEMVRNILDHPNITVHPNERLERNRVGDFAHVFYSGPVDGFYGFDIGHLPYRTLDFERFDAVGDVQGCAVMNYTDECVPTRRTPSTSTSRAAREVGLLPEFSRACEPGDLRYYPINVLQGNTMPDSYITRAQANPGVTFVGRSRTPTAT